MKDILLLNKIAKVGTDNFDKERLKLLSHEKQKWLTLKYGENIKKLEKVKGDKNDRY